MDTHRVTQIAADRGYVLEELDPEDFAIGLANVTGDLEHAVEFVGSLGAGATQLDVHTEDVPHSTQWVTIFGPSSNDMQLVMLCDPSNRPMFFGACPIIKAD